MWRYSKWNMVAKIIITSIIGIIFIVQVSNSVNSGNKTAASSAVNGTAVSQSSSSSQASSSQVSSSQASSSQASSKADSYITKAKFDQIQNGMSYEQVKSIIGSDGELMSEVGTKGDAYYTVMYDWKASDGIANATFEFQDGKLQLKSQVGLQ